MTYNQVNYIAQALDSILCQELDVDFDILIHDDCSDDGTYEILLDYQKQHPHLIRIVRQEERKFIIDGFNLMIYKYVVPEVKSRYVAYCDGDDYWCDKFKLKKQIDFMKAHPDYSMCFHNAYQLKRDGDTSSKWFIDKEGDIDLPDIINDKPGIGIATSSIFLKNSTFCNFSSWRLKYPVEDVPLYMTAALDGKIHRLEDIMCVYRQFADGSWSSQNTKNASRIISHLNQLKEAVGLIDAETNFVYHNLVTLQIDGCNFRIARLNKDYKIVFSKQNKRFVKRMRPQERLSLKLQYKHPRLYNLLHKKRIKYK